ncbi:hypothetical protein [Legionella gresilensis]|uniref:hypothetical protein n=1 Tax=Legionella gresilensis TaxID=91823 RepID=UPI0010417CA5|nr:hypothetical protein [Legionella gresilensis]
MHEGHYKLPYRPMPAQSRFGLFGWPLHHESCYLPNELLFRQRVLTARATSGLDADLLQTSSSWFAEDKQVAFINENENSWFLNNEFRPRHELSSDDFHIGLIDNQRLNWPGLSTLMRNIGDYLLIRNSRLAPEHFNQPMNYVLLDAVQILKRLATIDNPTYVAQQLQLLRQYLRAIEIHIPPTAGSDRLFLADCRYSIEVKVESEIIHNLITQQLEKRLHAVKSQLNKVGELRHIILHFALAEEPVNPHPYWELFINSESLDSNAQFPTLAAKACATVNQAALTEFALDPTLLPVTVSEQTLDNCPEFKFIENLPNEVKAAYGKGIADLQEIVRIQMILDKLLQTFDRAGEVFTMIQFSEEMHNLLQGIEQFIQRSEKNILLVLEANTQAYHKYIQEKQDLTWWDKFAKNKQTRIDNFITNQDNLARFSTTPSDLHLASNELLGQVNQVINHLNQQKNQNEQLKLISDVKNLIEQLIDSMHAWVNHQRISQGLPIIPKKLSLSLNTDNSQNRQSSQLPPGKSFALKSTHNTLFSQSDRAKLNMLATNGPLPELNTTHKSCYPINRPSLPANPNSTFNRQDNSSMIWIASFLFLLPISLLILKILYDKWQAHHNNLTYEEINKEKFSKLLNLAADKLAILAHIIEGTDKDDEIQPYINTLENLKTKLEPTTNDVKELKELIKDVNYQIKSNTQLLTNGSTNSLGL